MTEQLVKHFVKDYQNVEEPSVRTAYGIMTSVIGIICNLILFAIKLIIGGLLNSISVMADAFNNLSDAASSIIGFIGVKMANKPADKEHPFGHGRVEYIAALIVSFLVIEVGFTFFKSSIGKIQNPEEILFSTVSVLILCLSVFIKLWLGYFNRTLGKRIHSKVMEATAADAFGDVLTTLATVVAIVIGRFTGLQVDGYMGFVVSLMVMWSGFSIAKDTIEPLIGEANDPELCKQITELVESYDGIIGTHDLIVHNYGPSRNLASIHAEVPNNVSIEESHEIIDRAEREVSKKLNVFLVIHMDPVEMENEKVLVYKQIVAEILHDLDRELQFHDFRMVDGKEQINLIFDVVMPYQYAEEKENKTLCEIVQRIQTRDSRCQCVITVDKSYRK